MKKFLIISIISAISNSSPFQKGGLRGIWCPKFIIIFRGLLIISVISIISLFSAKDVFAATISSSLSSSGSPNNNLKSGLVGWWTFDGADVTATQVLDKSGNNLTLTRTGGTPTKGKLGQGITLVGDSTDSFASASNSILDNDVHTIAFWMRMNAEADAWTYVLSYTPAGSDRSPGIWKSATFRCLHWRYSNTGLSCGGPTGESSYFTLGKWYYIVGVKNLSNFKFYVDGAQQAYVSVAYPKTAGASAITIGKLPVSFNAAPVTLDDVRVYSRALSASEVRQLYSLGQSMTVGSSLTAAPTPNNNLKSGLVGHWTFDGADTTATQVLDKSGTGNTGTKVGGVTGAAGKIGQAAKLDGSSGRIGLSTATYNDNSTCIWIKTPTPGTQQNIFGGGGIAAGELIVSNLFKVFDGVAYRSGGTITANKWTFVCMSYNTADNRMSLYKDAVQTYTGTDGSLTSSNLTNIGASGGNIFNFNGLLDDARIYSRALSATEVRQLYSLGQSMTVGSSLTSAPTPNNNLKSGLVGWWTMDGQDSTATTVLDKSGYNNTGTRTAVTPVAGKIGQAMKFNGINSYIAGSSPVTATGAVSSWAKEKVLHTDVGRTILSKTGSRPNIYLETDGNIYASWNGATGMTGGAYSAPVAFSLNKWHHVVFVFTSTTYSLYLDGVLRDSATGVTFPIPTGGNLNIGFTGSGDTYFDGSIDDVRIYSRALSAAEVRQLYALGN